MFKTDPIPNRLSVHYASPAMGSIWAEKNRIIKERELWITLLKVQKKLGANIPDYALKAYEEELTQVNLDSIHARIAAGATELQAHREEFCSITGKKLIHQGLDDLDITENVDRIICFEALELAFNKALLLLKTLTSLIVQEKNTLLIARFHNLPTQPTTLGRRLCFYAEELFVSLQRIYSYFSLYYIRGFKGKIGTQDQLLNFLSKDTLKIRVFEKEAASLLKRFRIMEASSSIYPRHFDFILISHLNAIAAPCSSFIHTLRLMAGLDLVSEKPSSESTSTPKLILNCEQIDGLFTLLQGYLNTANSLSGRQWNEGDTSSNVVRSVILPDSFLALDGILELWTQILNKVHFNYSKIQNEYEAYFNTLVAQTPHNSSNTEPSSHSSSHKKSSLEHSDFNSTGPKIGILEQTENNTSTSKLALGTIEDQIEFLVRSIHEWTNSIHL